MKQETFINFYQNDYKKGTYVKVVKETIKGHFSKVTEMVARFVNYYNIERVKAKGTSTNSKPREYEEQIIPHILKRNLNTNNDLVMVYKTYHHRAYTKFYFGDMEISEEEYYAQSGDKKREHGETPVFAMKLDEIKSVGGIK